MRLLIVVSSILFIHVNALPKAIPPKAFMVCGDSKILLVDYMNSNDTNPKIIWQWDAHVATELPEIYRTELFNTVDDCKSANNGKHILVSSSSGAVGIIDTESGRVIFYTRVPNGHSMELLSDNRLIAASSLDTDGNKLMLFDINQLDSKPLFTDTLESAHGVVWDNKRNRLYALGFNVSREYKMISSNMLLKNNQWTIQGTDGHDLQMTPGGDALFVTEETGAWKFNLTNYTFGKIQGFPDAANIKSLGQDNSFQYIYTIEEESYWTYHVRFFNPIRVFTFPTVHVYKARWFNVTLSSSSIVD